MLQTEQRFAHGSIIDVVIILLIVNAFGLGATLFFEPMQQILSLLFPTAANQELLFMFLASLAQAGLFIGLPTLIVIYKYKGTIREMGMSADNWTANAALGFAGGIALFVLVIGTGALVNYFVPLDPDPQPFALLITNATDWKQIMLLIVMGSILAPVGEEFLFRGFIYPVFRKQVGVWAAIIISSVIFAGLHFDIVRMIPLAVGGMGLTWLYERTGSLITPVIAHSVWNTIMTIMILLLGIT